MKQFGQFLIDQKRKSLLCEGQSVKVPPVLSEILSYFVDHAGCLVTKKDLLVAVWAGRAQSENNIKNNIERLRKLLKDDSDNPRFIATKIGYGYEFVCTVKNLGEPPSDPVISLIDNHYVGEWSGHIDWNTKWANSLFNYDGTSPINLVHPRSDGTVHIYKTAMGVYKGISIWDLRNGPDVYAHIAASSEDFEIDEQGMLRKFEIRTLFRSKLREYAYAPHFHYVAQFNSVSEVTLKGKILVHCDEEQTVDAGSIILQLK